MGGGASKKGAAERQRFEDARAAMLVGKVEMGVEMLESLRAKLRVPGKGTRKGMEDLLLELEALLDSGQKAKADLDEVHEESIVLIKDAEDLLGKGEMDAARDQFQAALDRYQTAFKTSTFAEHWVVLTQDAGADAGPQWTDCHESMSIDGSYLLCEESGVGTAITSEIADVGKLMCEIKIKTMKDRAEGEDSDIFFGVMRDNISLDEFWFEEEFEDLVWFYSDDGDICTGEETLEDVAPSWAYKQGDTVRLELEFTDGEDGGVLTFYKNGKEIPQRFTGVEGPVVAAVLMSDCQEGDCIELLDLQYDPGENLGESAPEDVTDELHHHMPVFSVMDAFASFCRAHIHYINFQEDESKAPISTAKKALTNAMVKLHKITDKMRCSSCRSKKMKLVSDLKSDFQEKATSYIAEAEKLVEEGKLTKSFKIFDLAIAMMQKIEEAGMLKEAKKARQAAVARRDMSFRNADRMMKLVRSRVKSEVMAVLFEGYEESIKMAGEAAGLFSEAGEPDKSQDAEITKSICEDLQEASVLANSAVKAFENARISGVKHHFQKANDEYAKASVLCNKTGNKAYADELKVLAYAAMEAYKDMEAADAEGEKGVENAEDIEKAVEDYADMLDGKPDEEEPDAGGSVEPCLTGVISRRIMAPSKVFSVYVSSSVSENENERLCLSREVAEMVRHAVLCFGFDFEFVDPFFSLWNAPELAHDYDYRHKCHTVMKQCQEESAGIDFLLLVGQQDNGISFPGTVDFDIFSSVIKCIPDRGELGKLRKVVIDWYKLDTNSNPRKYVILDREKKIPNLSSIDPKKRAIGQQEWERVYEQLQKGFYEAVKIQIHSLKMQKIRMGILGKLGKVDSYSMKKKANELFAQIDVDGSGQIDVEELQVAFEQLDVYLTEKETRDFMDEFDEDKSGEIGFDEFLLIIEKLLLDAKNHEKEDPIKNVDHAKYFMQSLLYQDACDGMLDRPRDIALKRSAAVMWGFDPMQMGQELTYVEMEDEFDHVDAMATLRKEEVEKKGGEDALEKHEGGRPEWLEHTKIWQLKETVFKKLVDMEEYVEENPPDDAITPETPNSRDSSIVMLNIDSHTSPVEARAPPSRGQLGRFAPPPTGDELEGGDNSREDTAANDKFGGRRIDPDVWEVMSHRKSVFLKTLSDWEFMRIVSRSKRKSFRGSTDRPFIVARPSGRDIQKQEGNDDLAKANETIKRMNDKIARLTDSERRERNAMAKARMQDEIMTCEETLACLEADSNRAMYVVLNGELEVVLIEEEASAPSSRAGSRAGGRPKTTEKKVTTTKLAVLKQGDAFGDLTLVLGMDRDTTIRAITPVDLAVIRYDMIQSLIVRNPKIESRLKSYVTLVKAKSKEVQTHHLTRAIPFDAESYKKINAAMATLHSPLMKVLTGREVENLSKAVSILSLPPGVELYRQDDGQESGWGPFGDSAFIILEGEVSVTITFEDDDELVAEEAEEGKAAEVARVLTMGESVGDMNLVTGAARTSTAVTATACTLIEITRECLARVVHRDIRQDLMSYLGQPQNGNVEARVLSQRCQHAMRRRRSTFLKQLSDIEIDFLASVAVTRVEDKHTWVVKQDEWGNSAFVVLRGQLRVMVAFAEGEMFREVGRLKGGDVFGEMTLLLDYPRSSTVEVISKQAMLVEITRDAAEKLLNYRSDIMDTMEMMLHGEEGLDDIMRARTPLGGRAATPGGVVATGLKTSISCVSYPWKSEEKGMHAEMRGKPYMRSFAQKVVNAIIERVEPALESDARRLEDANLPLLQECSFHLDVAARKTEVFCGRKDEMKRLVDYIEGEYQIRMGLKNQPTILMGEAGVGKSSLLAMAGIRAKARNPGSICVFRFMGWTQESLNVLRMMKSILTQLMMTFGMKITTFPDDLPQLREMLLGLLGKATKQELICLVLDAVDDLDTPAGFMPSFDWLPMRLPKYSSIILSLKTSSVNCINVLNTIFTGEVYFNVYALRPVDAQPVLEGYLDKRGKTGFHNSQFEAIRKATLESAGLEGVPLNCSPLFLNLCINLSDNWVSFDPAPTLPDNIPDLVKMVYDHLEKRHGPVLVEHALSYLYTSREGLVWQELYDLLSCDDDVLDDVYKPVVPKFRRIPSFKAKLLSNDLDILVEPRFNNQVPTYKFRYHSFRGSVFQKYGLENTVRQCSFHKAMACYFSGEWVDGKEMLHLHTHQWKPDPNDDTKYDRGINPQHIFLGGEARLIFHRRKKVANMRKIREMPYHICWSSGRSPNAIDPISRALTQRPPSSWNSRSESDRNAQIMFLKHFCRLEIVEAACLAGYAHELHDDMLLAKKIFPYSELVRQFHKLVHEAIVTLAGSGQLTFQCALNAAGNGQGLINGIAQEMLDEYHANNIRDGIPDVWMVHTNKDEVMDSLYVQYLGHWGGVFSVAISNRDDIVMTGGADCSCRLYDATSGNEVKRVDGHVEAVLKVNFSLDNKKIITSSADMTAIIWDVQTGDPLTRLEGHDGEVLDGIFLSSYLALTASNDSSLRSWKVDTGQVVKTFIGHKSAVTCCISMAKGIQVVSASFDKSIRIWETETGRELLMLAGHNGVIYNMDLSRDQRRLLSCASDQLVKVWDLDEGLEIETLHLHEYAVTACSFDPTGAWIVTGGIDKTVRVFELNTSGGTDAVVVGEHKAAVCSIKFSNDGDFILSAGADGVVSKWEWAIAHQVATDSTPDHTQPICHVEFSATGKHCASLSSDGVTILRVLDWRCCTLVAHQLTDDKDPATACKFAPNGWTLATLHAFGSLLWDTKTGNLVGRFAQVFNLHSLNFPEEVEYGVAPPLSPLVKPDGDIAAEIAEEELKKRDPKSFNEVQMQILHAHAKDRFKKRFRADYLNIARQLDNLEGGRSVNWRDARDALDKVLKEEERKSAEKQRREHEAELEARRIQKHHEQEALKRKAEEMRQKLATDAEAAIDKLMSEFRFCEHCGVPWISQATSCLECGSTAAVTTSDGFFGSCRHCESSWVRQATYCHRCGSERELDAEEEARELGIGESTDERDQDPVYSLPLTMRPLSQSKDPGSMFSDGLHVWFDALHRIVTGTDVEVSLVKKLVQADVASLAQGKLNAEISVFGRELTKDEREAWNWNLDTGGDGNPTELPTKHGRTDEVANKGGHSTEGLAMVEDVKGIKEENQEAVLAQQVKPKSIFQSFNALAGIRKSLIVNRRATATEGDMGADKAPIMTKDENGSSVTAKDLSIVGTVGADKQVSSIAIENRREDSKAHAKSRAQVQREKTLMKRRIIKDMLGAEVEVVVLGQAVTGEEGDSEREATWHGPKKNALERQLVKAESAKKKALEESLQEFLRREGYGEIPDHVHTGACEVVRADVAEKAAAVTLMEDSPCETDAIVTKGVAIWMKGIAGVLTGQGQQMDLAKQVLQDDNARLALMKANAEVGLFGRELTEQEREAAWRGGSEETLSFLRPGAELQLLGRVLSEGEREDEWSSGLSKEALAACFADVVQEKREALSRDLASIQRADQRMLQAASRPTSAGVSATAAVMMEEEDTTKHSYRSVTTTTSSQQEAIREEAVLEAHQIFRSLYTRAVTPQKGDSCFVPSSDEDSSRMAPEMQNEDEGSMHVILDSNLMADPPAAEMTPDDAHIRSLVQQPVLTDRPLQTERTLSTLSNSSFLTLNAAEEGERRFEELMLQATEIVGQQDTQSAGGEGCGQGGVSVTLSAENFGVAENGSPAQSESGYTRQEEDPSLQVMAADGAEILRIDTAPPGTAGTEASGHEDAALQRRISLYTDVDVEVIHDRPGTGGSVQLRPRTGLTGSESGPSRPHTGPWGDRPHTSHSGNSIPGSGTALSRPGTGDMRPRDLPETQASVDVFNIDEDEIDQNEIDLTVSHDTALWSLNSLLKFLQKTDPKKLEERAKKEAEDARRARLKMEARKRKATKGGNQEQKEVYDVDKPDKDVDIEIVQNILFMLDQLEATTNPSSDMHGKSSDVLAKIGNERTCRRNIAFPARGIPSLNFVVLETVKPYLKHPEKAVRLVAIECISNVARPGDATASAVLAESAADEDAEIKAAAVAALSKIATAEEGDDDEDKADPLIRKMLTVTVKAASSLVAADASGTSDPFATVAMQAFDADIDEIKTMREQNFGAAKELLKSNFEDTMEDAPSMVDLALKRMLLKRALILEMTTSWDHKEMVKDCNFITLEKNKILFVQGDAVDSLFMVISGTLRVMVKFDTHDKPKEEGSPEASKAVQKVPVAGKHDLGQQVALLDKGDTIGEMSLILQEDQTASILAAVDCNILEIPRQALLALKKRRPAVVTDLKIRAMKQRGLMVDEDAQKGPKAVRKTDVKTKTLDPVWEETFHFFNVDMASSLLVSIFDHDIVGSHDFLGRAVLDLQSLPINQDLETWFPLEARSDEEEVSGQVCLHLRLQTDKRKRIQRMDGETFVSEIDGNILRLMRDSASNDADPRPETFFRLGSKIGAWHVSPADPRNIAVGDQAGGVYMLRVQDIMNYRWECEELEDQAAQARDEVSTPALTQGQMVEVQPA